MTEYEISRLEQQLATLTEWTGPSPQLWRGAADSAERRAGRRWWGRRVPVWGLPAIAASVLVIALAIPSVERVREARPPQSGLEISGGSGSAIRTFEVLRSGYEGINGEGGESTRGKSSGGRGGGDRGILAGIPASQSGLMGDRQVIRKVTLELAATDVRAAYLKAQQLVSEARGEFIQDSSLSASGDRLEGSLTLRIAVDRLPAVLDVLRGIATVRNEAASGDDVTAQVVDVEARLSNERRVETELLQLLEKRQDAPLKDVLELRQAIANVRQSIEQLDAQRQRLGHLVGLATVLVLIRPADAPPATQPGLGAYFLDAMKNGLRSGIVFLVDSASGLIAVIVGGFLWLLLGVLAIVIGTKVMRRVRPAR